MRWRDQLLFRLCLAGVLLGVVVFVPAIKMIPQKDQWALMLIGTGAYITALGVLILRNLPYRLRAVLASLVLFTLGVGILNILGPFSGGSAYLFCFAIVAGVLLGLWAALGALALNLGALAWVGWQLFNGVYPEIRAVIPDRWRWAATGASFLMLNTLATLSVTMLVKLLEDAIARGARVLDELKRRQEELRLSEEKFRLFADEASFDGIIMHSEGRILDASQPFARMFGYERNELMGMNAVDTIAPEFRRLWAENLAQNITGSYEVRAVRNDGSTFPAEVNAQNLNFRGFTVSAAAVRDISHHKQVELELREREHWYRITFEHTGTAMVLLSPDTTITMANEMFAKLSGYSKEEIQGKLSWATFIGPDELARIDELHRQRRKGTETPQTLELVFTDRSGDQKQVLLSIELLPESGNMIASLMDITERKKTEEALARSEQRYRGLLARLPDPVIVFNDRGIATYANYAFLELYGWASEEVLNKPINFFVPPGEKESTRKALAQLRATGRCLFRTKRLTKDGSVLIVDVRGTRQMGIHDDVHFIAVHRDLTRRTKAEEALKRSEAQLRLITNNIPVMIAFLDEEHRYRFCNTQFEKVFKHSQKEIIGSTMPEVVGREAYMQLAPHLQAISAGKTVTFQRTVQTDERNLLLEVNCVPHRNSQGKVTGFFALMLDITERARAEAEKAKLEAQLRQSQKMEAVGALAGGIAHDFNNLLHVIGGFVQLMRDEEAPTGDTAGYLQEIDRAVGRASELVLRLLTFSRKVEPELKPVDLNQEVLHAVKILERTIPKMITIEAKLTPGLCLIKGDANQLEQVLLNLGVNAGDAMHGGGTLTIMTGYAFLDEEYCREHVEAESGAYIRLKVTDTGTGMDPYIREHIFEPFYTTKEVGKGTGLGLSMVYGIVKAHRGHVTVASTPGQGTVFDILFPVHDLEHQNLAVEPEAEPVSLVGEEIILLVDDEEAIRTIAGEMLSSQGYQVKNASSGEQALEILSGSGGEVDLVVLDLGMPGMGGQKALQEMLAVDPTLKVLIASGYGDGALAKETLAQGAAGFISKPYRFRDMLSNIRDILGQEQN